MIEPNHLHATVSTSPTPIRWLILGLLFCISVVTYIDRVNISVTARQMMPALGLTDQQMGFVFSSFVVGYALFQIPGGWLGDRWGARLVLAIALLWWSCFTALTAMAAASSLAGPLGIVGALALVRFLLGVGEAVALPNFNRAVTDWLPTHERGLGIGIAIGGIGVGAAVTPPVTAWIMVNYGWQTAFYLSAALGIGLAGIWWGLARDRPSAHPWAMRDVALPSRLLTKSASGVLAALRGSTYGTEYDSPLRLLRPCWTAFLNSLRTILRSSGTCWFPLSHRSQVVCQHPASTESGRRSPSIPWKAFRRTPTIWWLVFSYSCLGYVAYVYMSWFYLYLVNVRGFDVLRGGLFAAAPFVAILIFCPLGGWATDRLVLSHGLTRGRKLVGMAGMILAAGSIGMGAVVDSPYFAIASLSLGAGWLYFTVGAYWSSTSDLSKAHAGTLSGLMNMGANIGGAVSPTVTPWIAHQFGWPVSLATAAMIAFLGGILWIWIDPGKGLNENNV